MNKDFKYHTKIYNNINWA